VGSPARVRSRSKTQVGKSICDVEKVPRPPCISDGNQGEQNMLRYQCIRGPIEMLRDSPMAWSSGHCVKREYNEIFARKKRGDLPGATVSVSALTLVANESVARRSPIHFRLLLKRQHFVRPRKRQPKVHQHPGRATHSFPPQNRTE